MDKYSFGEFIYKKRKEKGMTQDDLGRKLGVTNKAVSKWETGDTMPDPSLIADLAQALGVTADELLTQKAPEPVIKMKERKLPWILMACFAAGLLAVAITWLAVHLSRSVKVTAENYSDYYSVSVTGSEVVDTSLEINIRVTDKNVRNSHLKLSYTIEYYYELDGKEGLISYTDRIIDYTGDVNDFTISVSPSVNIEGDYIFQGFNVKYEVLEAEGKTTK